MTSDVISSKQQLYSLSEWAADVRTTTIRDPVIEGQISSKTHLNDSFRYVAQ